MTTSAATSAGKRRSAKRTGGPGRSAKRTRRTRPAAKATRTGSARKPATQSAPWRRRAAILALASLAVGTFYLAWLRDSSLVAVNDVRVEGVTSADRGRIVAALTDAARGMTTLHVNESDLAAAVRGFPAVAAVNADASFPHGMTIHVTEREPVLVATREGRQAPVAADGTVLAGVDTGDGKLPELEVNALPESGRLGGEDLDRALVIGAAPAPLLPLIDGATISPDYGVVLDARGVELRFGTSGRSDAKWKAIAAILADPELTSVAYVDVRVPGRAAVGGAGGVAAAPPATDPATTAASATGTTAIGG